MESRWVGRPHAARAIRLLAYVIPFVLSIVAAFVLSSFVPRAPNMALGMVRWVGIAAVSTVVLVTADRVTRRLLPLSALLGLTLVFPDQAPSRFKIAIRTGTTSQLRQRLDEAADGSIDETPSEAAERLLELVGMLSIHDRLTRGHSERVRAYTTMIGEEMGLGDSEIEKMHWAGLLHDVGKLTVPGEILNKPGKLTDEEFDVVKGHPMAGKYLVEPLIEWLGEAARAVWEHHERFDGKGYPAGLSGTDISIAARIVCVADSYDVMTSVRSYQRPMSPAAARAELATCSGSQFDPVVVRAFLSLSIGRLRMAMGPLSWLAQLSLFPQVAAAQAAGSVAAGTAVAVGAAAGSIGMAPTLVSAADDPTPAHEAVEYDGNDPIGPGGSAASSDQRDRVVAGIEGGAATASVDADEPSGAEPAPETSLVSDATEVADAPPTTAPDDDSSEPGSSIATPPPVGSSTTVPTSSPAAPGSTTTLVADDPPPPTTSGGPATTTTTAPAGTTATTTIVGPTTTTIPPSTTTTTSTTTATSTTTTTSTTTSSTSTTTTTVPPGGVPRLYLAPSGPGNTESQEFLPMVVTDPGASTLFNYDVDRDGDPGLLIKKDAAGHAGTDLTKVQKFTYDHPVAVVIDGDVQVRVHAAAKDFAKKDLHLTVGLYRCAAAGPCALLADDTRWVNNAKKFKNATLDLGQLQLVVPAGERLELRVALLDDSEDDMWLGFGTHGERAWLDIASDD